ncbi:hypothetical protein PPL_08945 [Heterostelium album PN500]|uniref:CCT-eta n=1 Tax=Heterostelium pallidum (strain ATCC 26659 / Pp 5 / PN500) TaxID=670386 RepID=D3BK64_HETP5|nr:hypothetical protein PPL_08945 [Heterostelium album PN500]EFA78294.1 hypothetical protein PPL_08945 [Heterostelium album PN500]|eukprot:XP_020430419.1 hypothetical protein PPL_08945 [Heterostelium album PN500]
MYNNNNNNYNVLNERIVENCKELELIASYLIDSFGPYSGVKIISRISDDKQEDGSTNYDNPSLISTLNSVVTKDSMTIVRSLNIDSPIYHILLDPLLKHKQKVPFLFLHGNGVGQIILLLNQILKRCSSMLTTLNLDPQLIVNVLNVRIDNLDINNYSIQSIIGTKNNCSNNNDDDGNTFVYRVIDGILFKQTFSYAGSSSLPRFISKPKILLLDINVELKHQKEYATLEINSMNQYQQFIDLERNLFLNQLDNIYKNNINVVLSTKSIGDFATQEFVKHGIQCSGRVDGQTMNRIKCALGGEIQSTLLDLAEDIQFYGRCDTFKQILIDNEKYQLFTMNSDNSSENNNNSNKSNNSSNNNNNKSKFGTILLSGSTSIFLEEAEIGLRDTIKVIDRIAKSGGNVVVGGGAMEMSLACHLESLKSELDLSPKESLVVDTIIDSLHSLIVTLSRNCGFNGSQLLSELQSKYNNNDSSRSKECVLIFTCDQSCLL